MALIGGWCTASKKLRWTLGCRCCRRVNLHSCSTGLFVAIMKLILVCISERNMNKHFSSSTIYISSSRDTYIQLALLLLLLGSRGPGSPEMFTYIKEGKIPSPISLLDVGVHRRWSHFSHRCSLILFKEDHQTCSLFRITWSWTPGGLSWGVEAWEVGINSRTWRRSGAVGDDWVFGMNCTGWGVGAEDWGQGMKLWSWRRWRAHGCCYRDVFTRFFNRILLYFIHSTTQFC